MKNYEQPDYLFWMQEQFGPIVTAEERAIRADTLVQLALAWDSVRKRVHDTPQAPDLLRNEVCGHLLTIGQLVLHEPAQHVVAGIFEDILAAEVRISEALHALGTFTRDPFPGWPPMTVVTDDPNAITLQDG